MSETHQHILTLTWLFHIQSQRCADQSNKGWLSIFCRDWYLVTPTDSSKGWYRNSSQSVFRDVGVAISLWSWNNLCWLSIHKWDWALLFSVQFSSDEMFGDDSRGTIMVLTTGRLMTSFGLPNMQLFCSVYCSKRWVSHNQYNLIQGCVSTIEERLITVS